MTESVLLAITACIVGVVAIFLILTLLQPMLISHYGLFIGINPFNTSVVIILGLVVSIAAIMGLVPSIIAYKRSLKDGLSYKV